MKKTEAQLRKEWERQMEQQRMQVQEIELKARFWKAQWEIRHYTLEAENLQAPYNEYVAAQKEKNDKAQAEFEEMIKKMQEQGAKVNPEMMDVTVTQEMLDMNPEMVEEGVKLGDTIQIPAQSDLTPEEELQALAELENNN